MVSLWLGLLLLQQSDSAAALRAARRAQADFESFRRYHVAEADAYGGQPCDLRVGRYCYWHDDGKEDSVPEPSMVREARGRLLARLRDAAEAAPGDDWITGQRVRYLIEDGRAAEAVTLGRSCRGTAWWCAALTGLALHATGGFAAADSAFAGALALMPEEQACHWRDISLFLAGELRSRYEHMRCSARAAFESRWWWLAAPRLSRPGNDRRTEHYARLTLSQLAREARSIRLDGWGDDIEELLMRFGPEVSWTRRPSSTFTSDPTIVGHERSPGFHFTPSPHAFEEPGAARPDDWALDDRHPLESYAPSYADRFLPLVSQVAAFRRGDSCLVAAVYDVSGDPALGHQPAAAALVLARDEGSRIVSARETRLEGREVLTAAGSCEPELLGLEIASTRGRWVARLRRGLEPPGPAAISDILLLDATDSVPRELAAALPHALARTRIVVGRVGLFWEVAGVDSAGEPVATALAVTADPRGWFGRAAESLGLASRRRGIELRWEEELRPERGVAARGLDLDLSALSPGSYRIELAVSVGGREPVRATRELELVGR